MRERALGYPVSPHTKSRHRRGWNRGRTPLPPGIFRLVWVPSVRWHFRELLLRVEKSTLNFCSFCLLTTWAQCGIIKGKGTTGRARALRSEFPICTPIWKIFRNSSSPHMRAKNPKKPTAARYPYAARFDIKKNLCYNDKKNHFFSHLTFKKIFCIIYVYKMKRGYLYE